ncbi:MAG: O-antigen ligase family protein [Sporolactobacillus sp.]
MLRKINLNSVLNSNQFNWILAVLEFFLALFLILTSNSVYFRIYQNGIHRFLTISFFSCLYILGLLCFVWLFYNKYHLKKNIKIFSAFLILYIIFCIANNAQYPALRAKGSFLILLTLPIFSFIYFEYCLVHNRLKSLFIKIENIMVCIAIFSLIMWLIGPVFNWIHPSGVQLINWGDKHFIASYFGIFFDAQGQTQFLGLSITRNTGIFVEAPMISFVLTTALLFNLFIELKNNWKTLILSIAILTSTSTTGIIIAIAIICLNLLLKPKVSRFIRKWKYIVIPIVGIFFAVMIAFFIYRKMQENMGSVSLRQNDFYAGFKAWLDHPFVGNGLANYGAIRHYMAPFRLLPHGNDGFSTGLMKALADGGLFLLSFYVIPVILLIKNYWKKDIILTLFCIFMTVLFIVTIIDFNYLFLTIISWMWLIALFAGENIFKKSGSN